MRTVDASTQTMLDAYRANARDLILFDWGLVDGVHGFWTGIGTFTHNTQDYIGAGALFEVSDIEESEGLEANAVTIALRAVPDTALTPDVLASIEDYSYKQTEVTLSTAFFDPDDNALVSVEPVMTGILDQITHEEDGDGGYRLAARIESRSRDNTRTGYRRRSHEDQLTVKSDDGSLKHAAVVSTQRIYWGRKGPEPTRGERTQRDAGR